MDMRTEILKRYKAIRLTLPNDTPITVLHIGMEQTAVATGTGTEPGAIITLTISSQKTAIEYFKHNPPTPSEIENAIVTIEDEVARVRSIISGASMLFTTDESIREIAIIAGIPNQSEIILTRDVMELTFERFVSVSHGRPISREGFPPRISFAATLLILREFMHHLQFLSITIRTITY